MFSRVYFVIVILLLTKIAYAKESMPTHTPNMPEYDFSGRVLTLNNMGWMHPKIDPITQQYLNFCSKNKGAKVLEIGAAYGYASEAALKEGAYVWVNDLDKRHLDIFKSNIKDPNLKSRVTLVPGNFPEEVKLAPESFDAILAVRVLHFFEPEKLEKAVTDIFRYLKKGGKVYIVAETPYLKNWAKYIPVYESKKANGDPYPGYFTDLSKYNTTTAKFLPKALHFLDPEVLTRVFTKAGFKVETAKFLNRKDYADIMRLDGRESVGFIAIKP
ncbi:MAG: hypothetical protein K0R02_1108 [Rickettsiaceae bacterium]|jgi:SAM-dependent methyltransferase|nr:hypothetical protein [Rickettsiaceae bacterium]